MTLKSKSILVVVSLIAAARVASAADASELWAKNCASCHAKDGSGNTVMGKKSGVENYQDAAVQAKFTDAQATEIIKNGKEKMKSFKDKLTDDEIKALVAYIRAFKK
jgi:mono/diheme cytochrome c family protein